MQFIFVIASFCGLLFPAWPILVLAPLGWLRRQADTLGLMFFMWVLALVVWLLARLAPARASYLIHEPVNTYVFFGVGVLLFIAYRMRKER